jgi:hypothetical protein
MDGIRASSLDVWLLRAGESRGAQACQSFEWATQFFLLPQLIHGFVWQYRTVLANLCDPPEQIVTADPY